MKKQLCLLVMCVPLLMVAQDTANKGIKWITGLTWEQVKQKAKQENKYIFIDAYTTWCGPCKMMDKYVYPNDTVGNFFNEHFIAVKAQMDVTDKDDQNIKDWYNDAIAIKNEYMVEAYPSLIFLSPEGKILQKEEGYRQVQQLISVSKEVITPGKTYNDPYKEYKALVTDYRQGIKHFDRIPYMIKTALKLQDADLVKELVKDHLDYAKGLNEKERYTKENIELWASFDLGLKSKLLQFFLKDGDKIDQVMDQKGYAIGIVDKSIQSRIVDSFFRMQKGVTTIITGAKVSNSDIMFMQLPVRKDGRIESDKVEADWQKLKKMISKSFSKDYVIRNVLTARVRWYRQHQNLDAASKTYFSQLDKYPPVNLVQEAGSINDAAWHTFLAVNDKKVLKKASEWMRKLAKELPPMDEIMDTYAGLLYKLGQSNEAIQWEEKAVSTVPPQFENQKKIYQKTIEQMKKGEPTYLDQGAIWK